MISQIQIKSWNLMMEKGRQIKSHDFKKASNQINLKKKTSNEIKSIKKTKVTKVNGMVFKIN